MYFIRIWSSWVSPSQLALTGAFAYRTELRVRKWNNVPVPSAGGEILPCPRHHFGKPSYTPTKISLSFNPSFIIFWQSLRNCKNEPTKTNWLPLFQISPHSKPTKVNDRQWRKIRHDINKNNKQCILYSIP